MNLFWSRVFRVYKNTPDTEKHIRKGYNDVRRYEQVAASAELKEFLALKEIVSTDDFRNRLDNYKSFKYSDTQEYLVSKRFAKLDKSKNLKRYFVTENNPLLAEFVNFKKSDDYFKLADRKEVKKSAELKKFYDFERSKEYKNYLRFNHAPVVDEYLKLKKQVENAEFQKNNAFWKNKSRYKLTEEYAQDQRFRELLNSDDIKFYLEANHQSMGRALQASVAFRDDFTWKDIKDSKWRAGFFKPKGALTNYSYANEQQAYNNGKNISVNNGELCISTRREHVVAKAWDEKLGFIMKPYEYTSDIITTADTFRMQYGLFSAKARFDGNGTTQCIWLASENTFPMINVCVNRGREVEFGVAWEDEKGTRHYTSHRERLALIASQYHLFTVRVEPDKIVWYVNNIEVFRTSNGIPKEPMALMISSFITKEQKADEARMFVEKLSVVGPKA